MISSRNILGIVTLAVLGGTLYSVINNTFIDTSDPLLAHRQHHLHHQSIFAQKSNFINQIFLKKAWGWTTVAFVSVWFSNPRNSRTATMEAWLKWALATGVWAIFVSWFFGPGLLERLTVISGGECVIALPPSSSDQSPGIMAIPAEYCHERTIISPQTHPALFTTSLMDTLDGGWKSKPRLYKGHDVSGHIFLLTLASLFLHDQLAPAWRMLASPRPTSPSYKIAVAFSSALMGLWIFMMFITSVYWHTPFEKLTGLGKHQF